MKKYLYIAIAAATLASCSQDDTLDLVQGEEIQFSNAFVENSTRATDPTYGAVALTKFNVYGTVKGVGVANPVNIYNGNEVTGTVGTNSTWTCASNKQYWITGATYNFAAVVDAKSVVTTDANAYGMPTKLTYETVDQKDLLYASNSNPTIGEKVAFTFDHLLSKAWFTVSSNTTNGYSYSVKNIKVSNFEKGTYTINGGTWAGETAKDIEFGDIEGVTASNNNITNETQMLLIPNTADFTVTFTIELNYGDNKVETKKCSSTVTTDLVKGHTYNFKLDLTIGNEIQFTVANNPTWDNGNTHDSDNDKVNDYIPVTIN